MGCNTSSEYTTITNEQINNKSINKIDTNELTTDEITVNIAINESDSHKITLDQFLFHGVIGFGGFGKVMCGRQMLYNELNALKRLTSHSFITGINFAFHNKTSCFLVLDLKSGGDLRYHLRNGLFNEIDIVIYLLCLENVILDNRGFPSLTDFGISYVQILPTDSSSAASRLVSTLTSGTKPYLAPELFIGTREHGTESDYWSLGIVLYELLFGIRPYRDEMPEDN
eukprot:gene21968-28440_t